MHDVCWTYAKETTAVYFEVFTFDAYMQMLKFYAFFNDLIINKQELSYRQQIAHQLRTQYAEGIYMHKYYTVTLKSNLSVTQGHWNYWIDHT